MTANEPLVRLDHVTRTYSEGKVTALDDVSLQILVGEFVSIIGRSGSGKSTLLNMLGGLDRPTTGKIWLNGQAVDERFNLDGWRSEEVGFVFQSYYLLPNLTAEENVQLPMFGRRLKDRERVKKAQSLLELVGLEHRFDHLPSQLSAGQRQRVAIARALANAPRMLLADEPTGSLDSQSGEEVLEVIESCRKTLQMAAVIVTHDQALANRADRIVRLSDGKLAN
jgi:ABC-type lipoprotein export system ATPase subunit